MEESDLGNTVQSESIEEKLDIVLWELMYPEEFGEYLEKIESKKVFENILGSELNKGFVLRPFLQFLAVITLVLSISFYLIGLKGRSIITFVLFSPLLALFSAFVLAIFYFPILSVFEISQ